MHHKFRTNYHPCNSITNYFKAMLFKPLSLHLDSSSLTCGQKFIVTYYHSARTSIQKLNSGCDTYGKFWQFQSSLTAQEYKLPPPPNYNDLTPESTVNIGFYCKLRRIVNCTSYVVKNRKFYRLYFTKILLLRSLMLKLVTNMEMKKEPILKKTGSK